MSCILRKWQLSDAEDLAVALNNENIQNNLRDGLPLPYTRQDAQDFIAAMLAADENETFAYAITLNGRAVGSIAAFRQGNIHRRTAELGYYLAQEYWGQGIITDAIEQICNLIFSSTDILRIYAEPFSYNAGSRRALEKAGFSLEGVMKNNAVKNGKTLDMCMYSLTRQAEAYPVRRLAPEDIPAALDLCWQVFLAFDTQDYSDEGVAAFQASLADRERTRRLNFYGAFDGDELVGVLCMRAPGHIADFFVSAAYQGRGIGRSLFQAMRQDYQLQRFTVHSSPYAVQFYKRLGFIPTDSEQLIDGLRFVPMEFNEP